MVVRMSNNNISYNYLAGLNKALYKQVEAMDHIISEKRLNRPSDDPVDTVLDMRYKTNLTDNEQYDKNGDSALSWMNTTYDCMGDLESILQRVRELIIEAAEPSPQLAYDAVAEEIDGLLQQAIQIGNTTLGDRYIFAGQSDRQNAPFQLMPGNPDTVQYTGDEYKISMVVNPGSANPSLDSVNITGSEVFNKGKFFDDLITIRDTLRAGGDPVPFLSETALGMMDDDIDKILTTQSHLSARVSMYNMGQSLLEANNIRIQADISRMEDVDLGTASIAYTIAQNAYNAALAMGSKLLPMSLVDFLR